MKKAIVIGSGAGGATAAKELQGNFEVDVLEAGNGFQPFSFNLAVLEKLRMTGLFFDERLIRLLFPQMNIRKTPDKLVLVNGHGLGGTTTLCTANALRFDLSLRDLGIDLEQEFAELFEEIPISTEHRKRWTPLTKRMFEICAEMELNPAPTPKMIDFDRCTGCGRCVLGCSQQAKWDSRYFLNEAISKGTNLITNCRVEKLAVDNGRVKYVQALEQGKRKYYEADLVILAAGGLSTPVILQNSDIKCENRLFVDPVLCVAAFYENARQNAEIPMPFIAQREHYIISPYFDYLSFFFNKKWRIPARNIVSLMIKLADTNSGGSGPKGINKVLTKEDEERLAEGVEICTEILGRVGIRKEEVFLGTLNAGHPGGMFPLTVKEAATFHHDTLPANLYIADATLFPQALGNPPILTIMAMAKRISRICIEEA